MTYQNRKTKTIFDFLTGRTVRFLQSFYKYQLSHTVCNWTNGYTPPFKS